MNKYLALGCLGLGLMVSPLLGGQAGSAVPSNPKIGIVDLESVLSTSPAGKRANDNFEKLRKTKQAQLDKSQDDLKRADAELVKQKGSMKDAELESRRQELEKKFVELQQSYAKLERELAADRNRIVQDLLKQAQPALAAIAKAEGVTAIFDQTSTVWVDPATDLTNKLIVEMK